MDGTRDYRLSAAARSAREDSVLDALERIVADTKPGEQVPPEVALAEDLGVSRAAIRQAMAHFVRAGRVVRYRGKGTFATAATPPPQGNEGLVSVLLPSAGLDAPGFYYGEMLSGITGALASLGIHYRVVGLPAATGGRADLIETTGQLRCSGIIEFSPLVTVHDEVRVWQDQAIPVVLIATQPEGVPWVAADNFSGALNAVNYLLGMGHRKIACVTDSLLRANSDQSARLEGYRTALRRRSIEVNEDWVIEIAGHKSEALNVEELRRTLFREGEKPTAVLACGYYLALAVMQALRRLGYNCPDDVSVIGFDDPESAAHLSPPLTTVAQPVRLLGAMAAWKLHALRQTGTCRIDGLLPCSLIVRDSCRCLSP